MGCSLCADIGTSLTANTGRDEYLPESTRALTKLVSRDTEALWGCPTCDAIYLWEDDRAFTGSGNNDEERLNRLPAARAAIVRSCLDRGGEDVAVAAARVEEGLFALPRTELALVLQGMRMRDRELARRFLPRMVADLARTSDLRLRDQVCRFVWGPDGDGAQSLSLIQGTPHATPHHALDYVAETCAAHAGVR